METSPTTIQTTARAAGDELMMIRLLMGVYWFDEALQAALKAAGWPPVSRAQSMLFANISAGEQRANRLAINLGVSRQSVSQMISDLADRGLVEVTDDPEDRRARIVSFSEKAIPLRNAAFTTLRRLEDELRARIGEGAFDALSEALHADWGPAARVDAERAVSRPIK